MRRQYVAGSVGTAQLPALMREMPFGLCGDVADSLLTLKIGNEVSGEGHGMITERIATSGPNYGSNHGYQQRL